MDPYIHTIIATACIAAAFYFGRNQGIRLGCDATVTALAAANIVKLTYDEDDNVEDILPVSNEDK